jgi:hypothetical protein
MSKCALSATFHNAKCYRNNSSRMKREHGLTCVIAFRSRKIGQLTSIIMLQIVGHLRVCFCIKTLLQTALNQENPREKIIICMRKQLVNLHVDLLTACFKSYANAM